MTYPSKHISIAINKPFQDVYRFAANPENMVKWAAGLSTGIKKEGDHWISESPMGKVKVTFPKENEFGIIDHVVTIPSGKTFYNPLRVIKNNEGSEVIFTLFRMPEVTDEEYNKDAGMILKDLQKLKTILEK